MIREIADQIFVFRHRTVEGNNGIVFGPTAGAGNSRPALAIDAGNFREEGATMYDFVLKRGGAAPTLFYTHGHSDHVLGSSGFREVAATLSHSGTPPLIRASLGRWAAEAGHRDAARVESELIWPTETLTDNQRIELGGRKIRFLFTPGHSPDHLSLLVEDAGVLFAGDAVVTAMVPTIREGDGRILEATLRRLEAMNFEQLIPGHGEVLTGRETIRAWIRWEADYLAGIRKRVRELLPTASASAIVDSITYAEFVGDRFPPDRHNMVQRHRQTVEKILAEERPLESSENA